MNSESSETIKVLRAEYNRLNSEAARLQSLAKKIHDLIYDLGNKESAPELPMATAPQTAARTSDALYAILRSNGSPMSRSELLKRASHNGHDMIPKAASLMMTRDDRFKGIGVGKGAKWALKEWPE